MKSYSDEIDQQVIDELERHFQALSSIRMELSEKLGIPISLIRMAENKDVCFTKKEQVSGFLYFILSTNNKVKIGWSANPHLRLCQLRVISPCVLTLLGSIPSVQSDEKELHHKLLRHKSHGEWFHYNKEVRDEIHSLLGSN